MRGCSPVSHVAVGDYTGGLLSVYLGQENKSRSWHVRTVAFLVWRAEVVPLSPALVSTLGEAVAPCFVIFPPEATPFAYNRVVGVLTIWCVNTFPLELLSFCETLLQR